MTAPFTRMVVSAAFLGTAAVATPALAASAKVEAVYEISIAGWGLARANLNLNYNRGRYEADLFMKPKGVARIVTAVRTSVAAAGRVRGQRILPSRYSVRADETDRPVAVDMTLRSGTVSKLSARPPLKSRPGRVQVTRAHRSNIVDPLSSGLFPIRTADGRDGCQRTLKIFDGWTRYDVRLSYKGQRRVSTKGYEGTVAVCAARWVPVSGHRPRKKEVQYLQRNRDLEMTLLPIPSARIAIPYSVTIGTPNGRIRIEPSRIDISGTGV
ncbi:MAG: DUF3108 domain-containing protein [Pseudomonadota bacterium]